MRFVIFGTILVAAIGVGLGLTTTVEPANAAGDNAPAVVVELFTSQGCSSCPPADALVERIATEPGIVAITRPVTYWNNLGWTDTLAREDNTTLQRAYAARGGTGSGVYTPQAMVQGRLAVVGSNEGALRQLIATARRQGGPSVQISTGADGGRTIAIDGAATRDATVSVVTLRSQVAVRIGSGENGGRVVRYSNVLTGERPVGHWAGGKARFVIAAALLKSSGADRAAVIIRQGNAGPILAGHYL
jgi:hypothetical protein